MGIIIGCRCIVAHFSDKCEATKEEYILQAMLLIIIMILWLLQKFKGSCKNYIHVLAVPFLLVAVIKKHIEIENNTFHLGECFCTFLLIMVFSSLNSPLSYYTVQFINILCIGIFYFIMIIRYGIY